MALQVWLPLDNSFKNLGVMQEGTTVSGGAYVNGKVTSKALATGSVTIDSTNASRIMSNTAFSLSVWVMNIKDNPSSGTITTSIFNTASSPRRFSIFMYPNYSTLHLSTSTNDANTNNLGYTISDFFPKNVWVHLAVTYGNGQVKVYKNGELVRTDNATFTVSNWNSQSIRMIETNGNRYLNDFRLYDHCLSLKEVKNLAKGLMLHYTLSRSGANLLIGSSNYLSATLTKSAKDGYQGYPIYANNLSEGTYIYSIKVTKGTLSSGHTTGGVDYTKGYWSLWLYTDSTTYSASSYSHYSTATCYSSSSSAYLGRIGDVYYWKISITSAKPNCAVRVNVYSDGTNNATIDFGEIKLESYTKDVPTPWIPNSADTLYTTMGFANNIEDDTSGYNNNGTRTNITTWNTDTARYLSSMVFNGSNSYIRCLDPIKSTTTEFTISAWVYLNNVTSTMCLWNGRTTAGTSVALFIMSSNIRFDDSVQTTVTANLSANKWIHIVATWKSGGNKILYINGVSKSSVSAGTLTKSNNYATIGLSSANDATPSGNPFNGRISDFRIYATALSESDVKELYETSASIDKSNNMHCYELVES